MVPLWLERSQASLILCPNPCLEWGLQGVGMENVIIGPEVHQTRWKRHTQTLGSIGTWVWWGRLEAGLAKELEPWVWWAWQRGQWFQSVLPSVSDPPKHTHAHTHSTLMDVILDSCPGCSRSMEPCGKWTFRVLASEAKGATENSCDLFCGWTFQYYHLLIVCYLRVPPP